MGHPRDGYSRREFVAASACGAASLLAACLRSPTGPADATEITARPSAPTETPTVGVSALGLADPFTLRDGFLFVPSSYRADTPARLLVLLHGAGQSSAEWRKDALFELMEQLGTVVLVPDSRSLTWDAIESGFGPDVAFIDSALRRTFRRCNIHPGKIGIGGFSDGATEALGLGLCNGGLFSSALGFSPGFLVVPEPRGKPRVMVTHGTEDPVLSFEVTRDLIVPELRRRGYTVEFVQFDGGHTVSLEVATDAFQWFASV